MYLINKAAVLVKVKQPCLDWINATGGPIDFTFAMANDDCHVYLIDEHDTEQELELLIQDCYKEIFENELVGWIRDKSVWPEVNYQTFLDWFETTVHCMVFDPVKDKIKKEVFLAGEF